MRAKIKTVFFFLLTVSTSMNSQTRPLLESDHIPLTGFAPAAYLKHNITNFNYADFKAKGLEGIIVSFGGNQDTNQMIYDKFQNINDSVKLIPNMGWGQINFIQKYTNSIYTKWQAANTTSSNIKAALQFNEDIAIRDSGTNVIVTKSTSDTPARLIWGSGYRQSIKYRIEVGNIVYGAKFRLMIKPDSTYPNPPLSTEGLLDTVCRLKVMFKEIDGDSVIDSTSSPEVLLKVSDFTFNQPKDTTITYNLTELDTNFLCRSVGAKMNYSNSEKNFARYVEFIVEWGGVDYVRFYFDNVTVSDQRGRDLTNPESPTVRNQIRDMANNIYNGLPIFNENIVAFGNTVAGWYGLDEPETIDHLEPIRIIGNLIRDTTNGQRPLFISVSGN